MAEEIFQINWLRSDGTAGAIEAVALALVEGGCAIHVRVDAVPELDGFYNLRRFGHKNSVSQHQLFQQEILNRLISIAESTKIRETVTGVIRQKLKLYEKSQKTLFENAHKVHDLGVPVVVDLRPPTSKRTVEENGAAAAEDVHEAVVIVGRQFIDDPQHLAFAAYPGKRCVQGLPPNFSSAFSSPSMAASSPPRIF